MVKVSISTVFALAITLALPHVATASGSAIDPDPTSPTLGELVDREKGTSAALRRPVVERSRVIVTRAPVPPRGAVTVIVPGRRLR